VDNVSLLIDSEEKHEQSPGSRSGAFCFSAMNLTNEKLIAVGENRKLPERRVKIAVRDFARCQRHALVSN
jgi:hypothetical protein